jgi:hypothetical protein
MQVQDRGLVPVVAMGRPGPNRWELVVGQVEAVLMRKHGFSISGLVRCEHWCDTDIVRIISQ